MSIKLKDNIKKIFINDFSEYQDNEILKLNDRLFYWVSIEDEKWTRIHPLSVGLKGI